LSRRRLPAAVLAAVFLLSFALAAVRHEEPKERISPQAAKQAALSEPEVAGYLARHGFTRERIGPLFDGEERVSFFDGARLVAEVAVDRHGRVVAWTGYVGANRLGSADARQPLIAGALLLAFLGATLARPLLTLRTLDVAALVAAFAGAFLANAAWLEPGLALCFAATLYLAGRCAFGRSPPVRPELRGRLLEFALTGAVLLLGVVTLASDAAGDVGYASVAGATSILDGSLPYGQLDRIVLHGDTYGPLAYVSYLPGAVLYPVRDALSDGMGAMVVALLAALIAAYALYAAGRREAGREAGLRLALAWLCFPVTIVTASAACAPAGAGAAPRARGGRGADARRARRPAGARWRRRRRCDVRCDRLPGGAALAALALGAVRDRAASARLAGARRHRRSGSRVVGLAGSARAARPRGHLRRGRPAGLAGGQLLEPELLRLVAAARAGVAHPASSTSSG
jgi:hypothetical protein